MKIGLFTDTHFSSHLLTCGNRHNSEAPVRIRKAYQAFHEAGCDLAVCLGDLTDSDVTREAEQANVRRLGQLFEEEGIPTVCVMGNHDAYVATVEDFYSLLGEACRPRTIRSGNATLLFLDACYFANGEHYTPGGRCDWTDTAYPFAKELKEELRQSEGDVYVFMHQNLDPDLPKEYHMFNGEELRRIFEESGKVRTVFQGHYHYGHEKTMNGIPYITLRALSEYEDAWRIVDLS